MSVTAIAIDQVDNNTARTRHCDSRKLPVSNNINVVHVHTWLNMNGVAKHFV
jgi:hypothetical protein